MGEQVKFQESLLHGIPGTSGMLSWDCSRSLNKKPHRL